MKWTKRDWGNVANWCIAGFMIGLVVGGVWTNSYVKNYTAKCIVSYNSCVEMYNYQMYDEADYLMNVDSAEGFLNLTVDLGDINARNGVP